MKTKKKTHYTKRILKMPHVDDKRLKGNYGQSVVAEWLSRVCFVRQVSEGTDVGIDLYCESIIENTPFLHFWVQVKAIPQNHIISKSTQLSAWFDFKTSHLRYWQGQPIPVYAFLVPLDTWPPAQPSHIFVVRITEHLAEHGIPYQKNVRLRSSRSFEVATIDHDLKDFISKIVPIDTSILLLQKGVVVPVPNLKDDEETKLVRGIAHKHADKILESILYGITACLVDLVLMEAPMPKDKFFRQKFAELAYVLRDRLEEFGLSALVAAKVQEQGRMNAGVFANKLIAEITVNAQIDEETKIKHIAALRNLFLQTDGT